MASGINLGIFAKFNDKGVKEAENAFEKLGKTVAGIGIAAAAAAGAAGLGLLTSALTKGFDRLTSIDNATNKLEGLGHSAQSVQTIMDSALASVKGTAFGLGDAATIAASAVAAGIAPGQELTRYLTLTADAAAIAGVSLEEMGSTMNNVRTIGAAYNDSLQIMAQKGIPIYTMLADKLGITTAEVKDLASEGQISADLFEQVMTEKFGGAALKAGDTVQGAFANMEAALGRIGAALLGTTFEELPAVLGEITAVFDDLTPQFKEIGDAIGPVLIQTFRDLMFALVPMIAPLMQLVMGLLPPFINIVSALAPLVTTLIQAFLPLIDAILPPLVMLFEYLVPVIEMLINKAILPLIPIFVMLVEAIAPLLEMILPPLLTLIEAVADIVGVLIGAIGPLIEAVLPILISLFETFMTPIKTILYSLLPVLVSYFKEMVPVIMAVAEAFLPLVAEILPLLAPLMMPFLLMTAELAKSILPLLIPIIQGLGKMFLWLVDNVLKPMIDALRVVVGFFRDLFGFNGKTVNVGANVPSGRVPGVKLAEGGIVMPRAGGTPAIIGEAGQAEAVIPLDRFDDIVGRRGGANVNIVVNAGMGTDGAAVGEQIVNAIRRYERTSGAVFAKV